MDYAVIAAGEGSRLIEEGIQLPKPLVELNGEPLISRLIRIFLNNKASSISIIVNEEMRTVQDYLKGLNLPIPLNLVIQSTPSSMHSFHALSSYLTSGKFCLTTVDTVFKEDEFTGFIQSFMEDKSQDGMMAVTDFIDDEKPLYVNIDEKSMEINGFLDQCTETTKYISGGIYCLTSKAIPTLNYCLEHNQSRMRNYQRQLIADGLKLKAYPFKKIVDVDHAGDILKAESFLLS